MQQLAEEADLAEQLLPLLTASGTSTAAGEGPAVATSHQGADGDGEAAQGQEATAVFFSFLCFCVFVSGYAVCCFIVSCMGTIS